MNLNAVAKEKETTYIFNASSGDALLECIDLSQGESVNNGESFTANHVLKLS